MDLVRADVGPGWPAARPWRPDPSPRRLARSRAWALVAAGLTVLGLLVDALVRTSWSAWESVLRPGPVELGPLVTAMSGTAAAVLTGWLFCAVAISALAALVATDRWTAPARWARRLAPTALRHGIATVLGVSLLAAPAAAATPRSAGDGVGPAGVATVIAAPDLNLFDASWRVTAPETRIRTAETVRPQHISPDARADLSPGWTPSAPASARRRATVPDAGTIGGDRLRPSETAADEVVVRDGDTLWAVAERHLGPGASIAEICEQWPLWWSANRREIGQNPDQLRPGMRLRPPADGVAARHARVAGAPDGAGTRQPGRHRGTASGSASGTGATGAGR